MLGALGVGLRLDGLGVELLLPCDRRRRLGELRLDPLDLGLLGEGGEQRFASSWATTRGRGPTGAEPTPATAAEEAELERIQTKLEDLDGGAL